jgi:hypothetical protein
MFHVCFIRLCRFELKAENGKFKVRFKAFYSLTNSFAKDKARGAFFLRLLRFR